MTADQMPRRGSASPSRSPEASGKTGMGALRPFPAHGKAIVAAIVGREAKRRVPVDAIGDLDRHVVIAVVVRTAALARSSERKECSAEPSSSFGPPGAT